MMNRAKRPRRIAGLTDDRGFSMMELLVGVALTVIILATTLGALNDGFRAGDTALQLSQMQANGRIGLNMMTRDLMQGGQGIPTGGIPIPSGLGVLPVVRPGPGALTFGAVLPAITPGSELGPTVQGRETDIITILYADSTLDLATVPLDAIAADGGAMTVNATIPIDDPGNGINPGDLIMFSNAIGNAIQVVTGVAPDQIVEFASDDPMRLNNRDAPAGTILQLQNGPGVYPTTTATRIWMITYYIDATNPDSPRLTRLVNNGTPRPVSLEIEDLQITYDLVDGFTNPAGVNEPVAPNSPAQIRKATVTLLARSREEQANTGQFYYQPLRTQVSFRSLSFVDRYQ